ncbi:MAG: hypothetical protein M1840_007755 [Geoglossum simile]|nr:MAG: hypothetical protein M1840_007755 [Geoglossum simile]
MHIATPLRQGAISYLRPLLRRNVCQKRIASNQRMTPEPMDNQTQLRPENPEPTNNQTRTPPDEGTMALGVVRMIRKQKLMSMYQYYLQRKDPNYHIMRCKHDLPEPSPLSHNQIWSAIANILDVNTFDINNPEAATVARLQSAAHHISCDYEYLRKIMTEFVVRRGSFQADLGDYFIRCQWASLAEQLYLDAREIHFVMSKRQAEPFLQMIDYFRTFYYESPTPEDPKAWIPNHNAFESTEKAFNDERERAERQELEIDRLQEERERQARKIWRKSITDLENGDDLTD